MELRHQEIMNVRVSRMNEAGKRESRRAVDNEEGKEQRSIATNNCVSIDRI